MFRKSDVFNAWSSYCATGMEPLTALSNVSPRWVDGERDWHRWLEQTPHLVGWERVTLQAAAKTGQLPGILLQIAQLHEMKEKMVTDMILKLLYPIFLIHASLGVLHIALILTSPWGFVWRTLANWMELWLVVGGVALFLYKTAPRWTEWWFVARFKQP